MKSIEYIINGRIGPENLERQLAALRAWRRCWLASEHGGEQMVFSFSRAQFANADVAHEFALYLAHLSAQGQHLVLVCPPEELERQLDLLSAIQMGRIKILRSDTA